jgi:uncharacterized protein (DUF4415 family)
VAPRENDSDEKKHDFSKGVRGAVVQPDPGKVRITIRLDEEIIDWFRKQVNEAGGGNYQTLIGQALREYVVMRRREVAK